MFKLYAYATDGTAWLLDLPSDFKVSLNFAFYDLQDVTRRNRVYSNTINLPSTNNNDRFFLDAYDHKSELFYNQKKSIKAYLTDDVGTTIEGRIFIVSTKKTNNAYSYSINFIGNIVDVFAELGDATLRDVFLYDTFTFDSATYINDYSAPNNVALVQIDNGDTYFNWLGGSLDGLGLSAYSLYPAVRLNWLLERIFAYKGFSIDANSIIYDNTTFDFFKFLYLVGDNYNWRVDALNDEYYSGWKNSDTTYSQSISPSNYIQYYLWDYINFGLNREDYDPNNLHDITTNEFTINGNYSIKEYYDCTLSIRFLSTAGLPINSVLNNWFKLEHGIYIGNVPSFTQLTYNSQVISATIQSKTLVSTTPTMYEYVATANVILNSQQTTNANINEQLKFSFALKKNTSNIFSFRGLNTFTIKGATSKLTIQQLSLPFGSAIPLGLKYIFKSETKATDVLRDILRAFNLLLVYDMKNVTIKSFSSFFDANAIDATDLVDANTQEVLLNSEYQAREITFKWANRGDYYNKTHSDYSTVGYGDRLYVDVNEFADRTLNIALNKIGTIALVDEGDGFIRNAMYQLDNGVKKSLKDYGLRIVLFNGALNKNTYIDYFTGAGTTISKTPIYSHYYNGVDASTWTGINDAIKNPTFNLNFAFPYVEWYSQSGGFLTTNNDIYRLCFYEWITLYNSRNSRILRCKMFISSEVKDILTHRKLVFYDGAYWIVNKINAFKGFGDVYEVELMKKFLVELPAIVTPIDTGNDVPASTLRVISRTNEGVSISTNTISADNIVNSRLGSVNNYQRHILYEYTEGAVEYLFTDSVIESITIVIDTLPDNDITLLVNGTMVERITSATIYTMKRLSTDYTSGSMNTTLSITTTAKTQGRIYLMINATKIN